ncbi:MAG: Asp-tRNA(Asn)/Glu-tRNA(Gln) amidotransferase subunit GatA [Elusimicrobiota bacterium]
MLVEKIERYIKKIKEEDGKIKAFIEIWEKDAIEQAEKIESEIKNGRKPKKLYGYIVAIKDNMLYEGKNITAASKILENYKSPYTATAVQRIIDSDGIIIGRTNMDEFAMGSSTENSAYFKTRNPHNLDYVPGGSSGGSAAAVAAGFCDIALGSDTGGSIRQPASFCGVYGLKPTYGTVSRYGLIAFASSLDQIGPIARDLETLKLAYETIKGTDPKDSTTYKEILEQEKKDISKLKFGVIEFDRNGVDKNVIDNFENAVSKISSKSTVKKITLPLLKYAISAYYIIASSEASSNLSRFDGIRYGKYIEREDLSSSYEETRGKGFGQEVKRRILLGTYALSAGYYDAYYLKAQKVRKAIKDDFDRAFKEVDVLMIPTTPTSAFKLGEKIDDPLSMYLSDIFTVPVNLTGISALSAPFGKTSENLPCGVQFISDRFCENYLFEAAQGLL